MRVLTVSAMFLGVLLACAPAEPRGPEPRATEPRPARESLRTVAARVPVAQRPTPDAKEVDGVPSVVLAPGFGSAKPTGPRALLLLAYLGYDERGVVTMDVPTATMELDTAPAGWRGTLGDMVAGEKRRVWVPDGDGFRVWDLELQSIGPSR